MVEELYTPEQLAQMHDSLWQCVLQFANLSAAQERNRIARDLHDSVGHALTALNFQLQTAIKLYKPDPNQAEEFLTEAQRLVKLATQEVRQSVQALRSDTLETQPLETLIQSLVDDLRSTTGIMPTVNLDVQVSPPSHLVMPVYRIIQEALNNIRKYAQASEVTIELCANAAEIQFQICDNGRGFDPHSVAGGYGLKGMHERVAVLKGLLLVESSPGDGCQIHVWLPTHISTPAIAMGTKLCDSAKANLSKSELNHPVGNISNISMSPPHLDIVSDSPSSSISEEYSTGVAARTQTSRPDLSLLMSEINLDFSRLLETSQEANQTGYKHEHQQMDVQPFHQSPTASNVKIGEWQPLDLNVSA
ncbi:sensor histidine kinase [Calothrix sp. NIES-3974]|uniref:sensor histidine kinase n=1 Tax=Calothrix sp. NIES-3974 TaxID=2005462 RepID=UPI000B5ED5ED|nr:sensor histidine kinase [Calothrix sp. NIES-3974]BAZ06981.1 histidine kinase [Calothrix sp. NIES-3974]